MSPQLFDAIIDAGPLILVALYFIYRSQKPVPDSYGMDMDKRERYARSNKMLRWFGPALLVISGIMFLKRWLR